MRRKTVVPRSGFSEVCSSMSSFESDCIELPDIDERLVAPETPYEIMDGMVVQVSPSDDPHGIRHAQILLLIGTHVGPEFQVACDMLTRTSKLDDIAPDASVFPVARHPKTGRRLLEQLAFEVVSTGSLGYAGRKAAKLVARGVRRVFAIDVEHSRLLEWSRSLDDWSEVETASIEDPVFDVPLPVDTLVRTVQSDDAVAHALLAKRNPVVEAARMHDRAEGLAEGRLEGRAEGRLEGRAEGHAEGQAEGHADGRIAGKREALIVLLGARKIPLDAAARERIFGERDPVRLDSWIARAMIVGTIAELLAEP